MYCTIAQRECAQLTEGVQTTATATGGERGAVKVNLESICATGLDIARDCGETAICGLVSAEQHDGELGMLEDEALKGLKALEAVIDEE